MKKFFVFSVVMLTAMMLMASGAMAAQYYGGGKIISSYEKVVGPYPSPYFDAFKKFGRGFVNMGTAPIELIKQPITEMAKGESVGEFLTGFVYGTVAGVSWTIYRELDGVYEVATFYLPSLEPAIQPEYIF